MINDDDDEEKIIIRMSSAGLIYKHYGKEIIKNIAKAQYKTDLTEEENEMIY